MRFIRRYPVKVIVYEMRRGGIAVRFDKACRIRTPTGEEFYRLKKTKEKILPPQYDYILPNNILILFSPSPSVYLPVNFSTETEEIELERLDEDTVITYNGEETTVKGLLERGIKKIEVPTSLRIETMPAPVKKWLAMNIKEAITNRWKDSSLINRIAPWIGLAILCIGIGLGIYFAYEKIIQIQQIGASMLPQLQSILEWMANTCVANAPAVPRI